MATASPDVLVHNARAARVGDTTANGSAAETGAKKVLLNDRHLHRVGDGHDDLATITGALFTLVGDFMAPPGPPPSPPIAEVACEHHRVAKIPGEALETVAKLDAKRKTLAGEHPTATGPSGRVLREETADMLDRLEPVDVIAVRLLSDAATAPDSLQVKHDGQVIAEPKKRGGVYKFQASCLFEDSIPILWGFWKDGTAYDVVGLPGAIRVHARSAHEWTLALKSPEIFKQKTGKKVDEAFAEKRTERPFPLKDNRHIVKVREIHGWKPWERLAPTAVLEGTSERRKGGRPKPRTHAYDAEVDYQFLTITRDDDTLELDNNVLRALDEFIKLALRFQGWYEEVVHQIPKWGFYTSLQWSILQGEIEGKAKWKELNNQLTWLWLAGSFKVTLFQIEFKACFGFAWRSFTLQAYTGVQGSVELDFSRERLPPPSSATFDIDVKSTIEGMLGVEAKAGGWADLDGKATVGFELLVRFSLGEYRSNPGRRWLSGHLKWLSPTVRLKCTSRVGISWSRKWELGEYVPKLAEHNLIEW